MTKSSKSLKRWILGLVILEAVLCAIEYLILGGDATTNPKLVFALILFVVNLPGVILASILGLQGQDQWGLGGDPRLGIPVIFGFSLIFYSGCIWVIQRALTGRQSESDQTGNCEK